MLKKELQQLVKEQQEQINKLQEQMNKDTQPKKKGEKTMKVLYVNTRSTQEKRIKGLMGFLKNGKTSKQFKDELEQLIRQEIAVQDVNIQDRNFYEIPKNKRPKGFNTKFTTYYFKK